MGRRVWFVALALLLLVGWCLLARWQTVATSPDRRVRLQQHSSTGAWRVTDGAQSQVLPWPADLVRATSFEWWRRDHFVVSEMTGADAPRDVGITRILDVDWELRGVADWQDHPSPDGRHYVRAVNWNDAFARQSSWLVINQGTDGYDSVNLLGEMACTVEPRWLQDDVLLLVVVDRRPEDAVLDAVPTRLGGVQITWEWRRHPVGS